MKYSFNLALVAALFATSAAFTTGAEAKGSGSGGGMGGGGGKGNHSNYHFKSFSYIYADPPVCVRWYKQRCVAWY
jgi:hypothetical protein